MVGTLLPEASAVEVWLSDAKESQCWYGKSHFESVKEANGSWGPPSSRESVPTGPEGHRDTRRAAQFIYVLLELRKAPGETMVRSPS